MPTSGVSRAQGAGPQLAALPPATRRSATDLEGELATLACGLTPRPLAGAARSMVFVPASTDPTTLAGLGLLHEGALELVPVERELCRVVELLEAASTPLSPSTVTLNHADGRYRLGDLAVVDVRVPEWAGAAFLYVGLVDPNGFVVSLFPSRVESSAEIMPGQELRLGSFEDGPAALRTVEPLGRGLLVTIVSPAQMPGLVVETQRPFRDYLEALRANLAQASRAGGVLVDIRPFETLAR